jgi:putative (di)nucleoside polyphosphate hydrolase
MVLHHCAGGVVIGPRGKAAVVSQHGRSWSLPKGGIDPGEDVRAAAEREIWEETGIRELEYVADLGSFQRQARNPDETLNMAKRKEIRIFLFRTSVETLAPQDRANPEARWIDAEAVPDVLTFPEDRAFYRSKLPEIRAEIAKRGMA